MDAKDATRKVAARSEAARENHSKENGSIQGSRQSVMDAKDATRSQQGVKQLEKIAAREMAAFKAFKSQPRSQPAGRVACWVCSKRLLGRASLKDVRRVDCGSIQRS